MMKYLAALFVFVLVLFVLVPAIVENRTFADVFTELFTIQRYRMMLYVVLLLAAFYPWFGFTRKERFINGNFQKSRPEIEMAFSNLNYVIDSEEDSKIIFRKKSDILRFLYFWEDDIEVDYRNNPLIISGIRKEMNKLDKVLDKYLLKEQY